MATFEEIAPSLSGPARLEGGGLKQPDNYPLTGPLFERISRVVRERFEHAEAHSRARFERFYRYEKLIAMISKKKSYEWKSNAYLPYALSVAEQSAAIKYMSLMGSRPWVTVQNRQAGLEQVAQHREALLDWRFLGDINLPVFAASMLRVAERYGKSIALVAPDWDMKILKYRTAANLPTVYGPLARTVWKTTQERAYKIRCEVLDNTDVFVQPGYKQINGRGGMRWIIRRYDLTIDELRELEAHALWGEQVGGQPVDEIRDTNQMEMNEYKARRLFIDKYDDVDYWRDNFDRAVELLEYQGVVPDELIDPTLAQEEEAAGLDPKKRLIVLANRKVVGINQALPWDHGMKSYIAMDSIPHPYDFWGTGKVEPIEHLVYVGNEIVNMRIDNVKAAINGLIGVDGSRMPAGWKRRLVSQPWGVVETQGPPNAVIERLQLGDVTQSSYQEQQAVFSMIQEATAINETMMGAPGSAVRTLGEHQLKSQAGTTRINYELVPQSQQLFGAHRDMPGLVYFILGLDRQYLPLPQYMAVIDPYAPDDFLDFQLRAQDLSDDDENFIFTVQGAMEGFNKQQRRLEFTQLNQTIMPMLQFLLPAGFNVVEFAKAGLRLHDFNPDRFFPRLAQMLSPDALGMGLGPQSMQMGLNQPGYVAGQPRQRGGAPSPAGQGPGPAAQPPLREPGYGPPQANRSASVTPFPNRPGRGGGMQGQSRVSGE